MLCKQLQIKVGWLVGWLVDEAARVWMEMGRDTRYKGDHTSEGARNDTRATTTERRDINVRPATILRLADVEQTKRVQPSGMAPPLMLSAPSPSPRAARTSAAPLEAMKGKDKGWEGGRNGRPNAMPRAKVNTRKAKPQKRRTGNSLFGRVGIACDAQREIDNPKGKKKMRGGEEIKTNQSQYTR